MLPLHLLLKPQALHIPDNLLSLSVSAVCWLLAAFGLFLAFRRTRVDASERGIPLMGIMAAFIFAAQMINFPVAGGTSGHLLGGVLSAVTLGPWQAILVMTSVIMVQGLLFQDGGLVAMGANVLNMGLLTVLVGYGLHRLVINRPRRTQLAAAGLAAWLSVITAALATSLQLWLSGAARLDLVAVPMLLVHALIGIGEALITVAALGLVWKARPELMSAQRGVPAGKGWIFSGLALVALVLVLSPLAAAAPDGLERVAADLGLLPQASSPAYSLLPDYTLPLLGPTPLSTILAGLVGAVVVSGAVVLLTGLKRSPKST